MLFVSYFKRRLVWASGEGAIFKRKGEKGLRRLLVDFSIGVTFKVVFK